MDRNILIFARTYNEALDLVVDMRDYLAYAFAQECLEIGGRHNPKLSLEAMRLSSRLMHTMAWLTLIRAIQNGEISLEEVYKNRDRFGAQNACLDTMADEEVTLPGKLHSLIDRSNQLLKRTHHLQEIVMARAIA